MIHSWTNCQIWMCFWKWKIIIVFFFLPEHLAHHLCSVSCNTPGLSSKEITDILASCATFCIQLQVTLGSFFHSTAFAFWMRQATGMSVINHGAMRAVRALSCLSNVCSLNSLQLSHPDLWPTCKARQSWRWPFLRR